MSDWLARLGRLFLPTRCLVCHRIGPAVLCDACAATLELVGPAHCLRCGRRKLTSWASPDCGECHGQSIGVQRARSLLLYNQTGRALLAELKYRQHLGAGEAIFAAGRARLGSSLGELFDAPERGFDLILPVPLHRARLRQRRFNQAEFFANRIGLALGLPVNSKALLRERQTPTQVGLSANQRRVNVRGAFSVNPKEASRLEGRRILLVDDLMTTGATLASCAAALRRAGAGPVCGLTMFSTFLDVEARQPLQVQL
jgi:ComF family protein